MQKHTLTDIDKRRLTELLTFKRLITEVYPKGIVSIVSDTMDLWNVIDPYNGILTALKDDIMSREGKVVIRPDSGDPVKIVTGWTDKEISECEDLELVPYTKDDTQSPWAHGNLGMVWMRKSTGKIFTKMEAKGLVECLYDIFGGTKSSTGYIQLDEHIGGIYGDSITLERAEQISQRLADKNFASTNLVYGIGSFTYQGAVTPDAIITRDTHCFAVKSTYAEVINEDGEVEGINIFKDPVTDDGMKKSAKGLTAVYKNDDGTYRMEDEATWDQIFNCAFVKVLDDGELVKEWTTSEIKERVAKQWKSN